MTTPSEDMAEIYSFIITDNKLLKNKTDKDTILKNKVSYLKNQLLLIDKSLKFFEIANINERFLKFGKFLRYSLVIDL